VAALSGIDLGPMLTALAELGLEPFRGLRRAPPGRGRPYHRLGL